MADTPTNGGALSTKERLDRIDDGMKSLNDKVDTKFEEFNRTLTTLLLGAANAQGARDERKKLWNVIVGASGILSAAAFAASVFLH